MGGGVASSGLTGTENSDAALPTSSGDGMLILRARDAQIGSLRLRALQRVFRLHHGDAGR